MNLSPCVIVRDIRTFVSRSKVTWIQMVWFSGKILVIRDRLLTVVDF
jgi:hypothetical protein